MDHRRRGMVPTGDESNNSNAVTDYSTMIEKDGILRTSEVEDHDHHHPVVGGIQESHTRSIVKGLTWRVLATSTVCAASFMADCPCVLSSLFVKRNVVVHFFQYSNSTHSCHLLLDNCDCISHYRRSPARTQNWLF